MKVTVENKKGLNKDLKILIDKETMNSYMDEKYEEIKGTVNLKGFRPGKVPKEVLKRQFGKAVFGEVLDKVLKDTSTKALEENKIKPAGQPKLDLKTYGEDKELEYVLSVTELPKVDIKSLENIKFDQYTVKIDDSETDKRIKEIAKNQPNFKDTKPETKAKEGDLVALDYKGTVDGKEFKGNEGKNTQLTLGKDLFLKGFDAQLIGVKKDEVKIIEATLPANHPKKELANKKTEFQCKILNVKKPETTKIDDSFAKHMGAKDLLDLKKIINNQISSQYKQALDSITKKEILDQLEKSYELYLPKNLVDNELSAMTKTLKKDDIEKHKSKNEKLAATRIKLGLILNEFGQTNNINVSENEINMEVQKQVKGMPGQEKMVIDYYQKNPAAAQSLRSALYEDKIISLLKSKIKLTKKELSTKDAEVVISNFNKPKDIESKNKQAKSSSKNKAKSKKISKK